MTHHNKPGWSKGDQYGDMVDCMMPSKQAGDACSKNNGGCHSARKCMVAAGGVKCGDCPKGWSNDGAKGCKKASTPTDKVPMKLKRFDVGKSKGANSHTVAHRQQDAFCKGKGGRLPTRKELCPNYNARKASTPALGCEKSHSWVPYAGNTDQWMYIGCPGTGHYQCKDHMTHHKKPGWSKGDQYGDKIDCMVPSKSKPKPKTLLKRFKVGKSKGANSHTVAHQQQDSFCKAKGGRLPTRKELCPNYNAGKASTPALGCEKSHSWVPYAGNRDQWMYIGCPGTGHFPCKDHMTHHNKPGWSKGDQYGDMVDCMMPSKQAGDACSKNNGGCHSARKCMVAAGGVKCGDCPKGWSNDGAKGCKKASTPTDKVPMKLKRFNVGKSKGANSHTVAHRQQDAFCKAKGGRLPTRKELCPNYNAGKASAPAL